MSIKYTTLILFTSLFTCQFAMAETPSYEIVGDQYVTVHLHSKRHLRNFFRKSPSEQVITMPRIVLSQDAKHAIVDRVGQKLHEQAALQQGEHQAAPSATQGGFSAKRSVQFGAPYSADNLPEQKFVGMSNVPVLNQGRHGSCVTFAVTGAINAHIEKGDYISQLCNLELGTALSQRYGEHHPSGWNGSWADVVLKQITEYGIIPKAYQLSEGCAGVKDYPLTDSSEGFPMMPEEFTAHSEFVYDFSPKNDTIIREGSSFSHLSEAQQDEMLSKVKSALADDKRVVIGALLVPTVGDVGASGTNYQHNDSWILTSEVSQGLANREDLGGHEIIVIGYDDNAVIKDEQGNEHQGVFTIRNSWGGNAGHKGNYYMSYDYFKVMVMDAHKIG